MPRIFIFRLGLLAIAAFAALAAACGGGDSASRRVIEVTTRDEACSPTSVTVTPKEKVLFQITNQGKKDYEFEGIEGAKIDEIVVPSGKTRKVKYDAPGTEGTQKAKCYVPGGTRTDVEIKITSK